VISLGLSTPLLRHLELLKQPQDRNIQVMVSFLCDRGPHGAGVGDISGRLRTFLCVFLPPPPPSLSLSHTLSQRQPVSISRLPGHPASSVQSLVFPWAARTTCGPWRNATKESCMGVDIIYTCVGVVFKGSIPLVWV
jgi:hypothetical protein